MNRKLILTVLALFFANFAKTQNLNDTIIINEVVKISYLTNPVQRTGESLFTGIALNENGLAFSGTAAKTSVYSALGIVPNITLSSADAFGLSEKEIRNRGIRSLFGGLTVEGIPNYGIMPIGGRDYIYDIENMSQISVFSGAVPSDLEAAIGSRGGVIELAYKSPQNEAGVVYSQSLGSDLYSRSYIRFDSGKLPKNLSVFGSYSYTTANKWKGSGKLAERHNTGFGIKQEFKSGFTWEIFGNYNNLNRHQFRPLSYEQTQNLSDNYHLDYLSELSADPAEALNYYDYNKGNYINTDVIFTSTYLKSEKLTVSFKSYFSNEEADYDNTTISSGEYLQQDRTRDITRFGFIPSIYGKLGIIKYSAGYWVEIFDNKVYVWNNAITPTGLQPKGYNFYTVPAGKGYIHSPYAKISIEKGKFSIQSGLKYFYFQEPSVERYKSQSEKPELLTENPVSDLHSDEIVSNLWLPSMGIGYTVNKDIKLYINYGLNYMRPYMYVPTISLYLQNKDAFNAQNMTLQSIYDSWQTETSQNFDFGFQLKKNYMHLYATLFYSIHNNVLTSLYDEQVGINYYQNAGQMQSYGISAETYIPVSENWLIYINPAYMRLYFTQNIKRIGETGIYDLDFECNQLPGTPVFTVKSGIRFKNRFLDCALKGEYMGERFGDATNIEKISDYFLLHFTVGFHKDSIKFIKRFELSAEINNILNTKFISLINVNDDSVNGQASYLTGYPRSILFTLRFKI